MSDSKHTTFRFALCMLVAAVAIAQQQPRVLITADPELDDSNTLNRAIL